MVEQEQRQYVHRFAESKSDYDLERHEEVDYSSLTPPFPILRNDDIQLPPALRLESVVYQDTSSNAVPLEHVSEAQLLEHRRGISPQGFTRMYSMAGTGIMRFWPTPSANATATITFVPLPPELTEDEDRPPAFWDMAVWDLSVYDDDRGLESTPRQVPVQFHYNTILPGVVVQLFDKGSDMELVQWWQGRYEAGLTKMMTWHAMFGGQPNSVHERNSADISYYPDQRNRR